MKIQERRIMRLNNSKDIIEVNKNGDVLLVLKEDNTFADEPKQVTDKDVVKTTEHERYRFYREKSKKLEYDIMVLKDTIKVLRDRDNFNLENAKIAKRKIERLELDNGCLITDNTRLCKEWHRFHRHSFLGFVWYTKC